MAPHYNMSNGDLDDYTTVPIETIFELDWDQLPSTTDARDGPPLQRMDHQIHPLSPAALDYAEVTHEMLGLSSKFNDEALRAADDGEADGHHPGQDIMVTGRALPGDDEVTMGRPSGSRRGDLTSPRRSSATPSGSAIILGNNGHVIDEERGQEELYSKACPAAVDERTHEGADADEDVFQKDKGAGTEHVMEPEDVAVLSGEEHDEKSGEALTNMEALTNKGDARGSGVTGGGPGVAQVSSAAAGGPGDIDLMQWYIELSGGRKEEVTQDEWVHKWKSQMPFLKNHDDGKVVAGGVYLEMVDRIKGALMTVANPMDVLLRVEALAKDIQGMAEILMKAGRRVEARRLITDGIGFARLSKNLAEKLQYTA